LADLVQLRVSPTKEPFSEMIDFAKYGGCSHTPEMFLSLTFKYSRGCIKVNSAAENKVAEEYFLKRSHSGGGRNPEV